MVLCIGQCVCLAFENLRTIGDYVDLAEWSLHFTALNQIGHLQAAMIQGLLYAMHLVMLPTFAL